LTVACHLEVTVGFLFGLTELAKQSVNVVPAQIMRDRMLKDRLLGGQVRVREARGWVHVIRNGGKNLGAQRGAQPVAGALFTAWAVLFVEMPVSNVHARLHHSAPARTDSFGRFLSLVVLFLGPKGGTISPACRPHDIYVEHPIALELLSVYF
jgi:hypothetical protein